MIYVKPTVRKGLLSRMLTELLDTRVMVKEAMRSAKSDKVRHASCADLDLTISRGTASDTGCQAARAQVYRQCDVRVYKCDVLGADACGGDC